MKKMFIVLFAFAGAVFFGLIAYAGFAPAQFAENNFLLALFRASGAVVFLAIIGFVGSLFLAGIRSSESRDKR